MQGYGGKRPTRLVDESEDLGCVALLRESGQSPGTAVDARHANGHDGDHDDDVQEVVEAVEAGVAGGQHEHGRTVAVRVVSANEARVVGSDEQADEEETKDVEERDTPEDLLDGAGELLDRVGGFRGSDSDNWGRDASVTAHQG